MIFSFKALHGQQIPKHLQSQKKTKIRALRNKSTENLIDVSEYLLDNVYKVLMIFH